jgi:hypothetical protein
MPNTFNVIQMEVVDDNDAYNLLFIFYMRSRFEKIDEVITGPRHSSSG